MVRFGRFFALSEHKVLIAKIKKFMLGSRRGWVKLTSTSLCLGRGFGGGVLSFVGGRSFTS
jgi:hypothetical protein